MPYSEVDVQMQVDLYNFRQLVAYLKTVDLPKFAETFLSHALNILFNFFSPDEI